MHVEVPNALYFPFKQPAVVCPTMSSMKEKQLNAIGLRYNTSVSLHFSLVSLMSWEYPTKRLDLSHFCLLPATQPASLSLLGNFSKTKTKQRPSLFSFSARPVRAELISLSKPHFPSSLSPLHFCRHERQADHWAGCSMDRETKNISMPEKHDPNFRENELHKGLLEMTERVARQT